MAHKAVPMESKEKEISPAANAVDATAMVEDEEDAIHVDAALNSYREPYGPPGFSGIFASSYVAACAAFCALGGLLFGYEHVLDSFNISFD